MTVFDDIYRTNAWAGRESRSGPGSGVAATEAIARALSALVVELDVRRVLNAGCGDDFWTPDLPGYLGVDVSTEAIAFAKKRHPERRYMAANVAWFLYRMQHGGFDLVICRDVIQHLPFADAIGLLDAIRLDSGCRWLLASTFVGGENVDVAPGEAYSPDMTAEPFSLGEPDRLIFDGWGYDDAQAIRDPRKHLGLWRLR
jgi:SAM-dependent methyltransferase